MPAKLIEGLRGKINGSELWMVERIMSALRSLEPEVRSFDKDICAALYGRNSLGARNYPPEQVEAITRLCVAHLNIKMNAAGRPMISASTERRAWLDTLLELNRLAVWRSNPMTWPEHAAVFERLKSIVDLEPCEDITGGYHTACLAMDGPACVASAFPGERVFLPIPGKLQDSPFSETDADLGTCLSPLDHLRIGSSRYFTRRRKANAADAGSRRILTVISSRLFEGEGDPSILWAQARPVGLHLILNLDGYFPEDERFRYMLRASSHLIFEDEPGKIKFFRMSMKTTRGF